MPKEYKSTGFPLDDLIDAASDESVPPEDDWEKAQRKKDDASLKLKAAYLAKQFNLTEDEVFKSLQDYSKAAHLMSRGV